MGTANLGRHARRGAGILIMGVSGGAVFPPIQGAIADRYSTRISFLVPMVGFIVVLAYALFHWTKHGFKIFRARQAVDVLVVSSDGHQRASIIRDTSHVNPAMNHLPQASQTGHSNQIFQ